MPGGTQVTVTGTCFDAPGLDQNRVSFKFGGSTASKGFDQCQDATTCVVYSPPAAGVAQVDVMADVDGGESMPGPNARFSYIGPTIASLQPNHGPKTGGTDVVISGGGFPPYRGVFPNMPLSFGSASTGALCLGSTVDATTSCSATTPAVAAAGPVQVVANAFGAASPPSPGSVFTYDEFPALTKFQAPDNFFGVPSAVFLNGDAPPGGAEVTIASDAPDLIAPQQPTATIPAGKSSIAAPLTFHPSAVTKTVTLTATYQGSAARAQIVVPASPPLAIELPPTLPLNQPSNGTITLNAPAPVGGALIVVTSDDPAAIAPPAAPVKVAAGNYTAVFPVVDVYAGKPKWVKFVATYSGAVAAGQTWTPAAPDQTCPRRRVCPRGSWWDDQECACLRGPPQ